MDDEAVPFHLIVAPHYRIVSSGLLWPDLGLSRIATITPSTGDRNQRMIMYGLPFVFVLFRA